MKTLAEIKRACIEGVRIQLVGYGRPGEHNLPHKFIGKVRTVSKVQTNGIWLKADDGVESFLDWPSAKEVKEPEDEMSFAMDGYAGVVMKYRVVPESEVA